MSLFKSKTKELYLSNQVLQREVDGLRKALQQNPLTLIPVQRAAYTNMLSTKDRITCSARYEWDIPINLTSQQLESMFYSFFSLVMFEDWTRDGILTFSRYSKLGKLNPYGELDTIQPIDLAGKKYGPVISVINSNNTEPKEGQVVGVIINDYTPWLASDTGALPRANINSDTTIHDQVEVYNQLMTNIMMSVKKALALCESEDQKEVVMREAMSLLDPTVPLVAVSKELKTSMGQGVEMFNFGNTFDTQNYCQTIDFYDKVRRGFNGIPAPDTFEKKERMITSEAENSGVDTDLVLQDGLNNRRKAVELFTRYALNPTNKNIRVDISEALKPKKQAPQGGNKDGNNNADIQAEGNI